MRNSRPRASPIFLASSSVHLQFILSSLASEIPPLSPLLLRRHVGDDVVLVPVGDAGEYAHGGAGNHDGRQRDPGAEQSLGPFKGRGIAECVGVLEVRHSAGAPAEDTEEVWADAVLATLVDG